MVKRHLIGHFPTVQFTIALPLSRWTKRGNHMARVTRAASHLSAEEVKRRLQYDPRPWCRGRWLIIYNALVEPRKAEEIARHCGVSKGMVIP